jgi:hypothetical protein
MDHPSGVKADDIAEYMGFNLGMAFTALWEGELERARHYVERYDSQRGPLPHVPGYDFRLSRIHARPCSTGRRPGASQCATRWPRSAISALTRS